MKGPKCSLCGADMHVVYVFPDSYKPEPMWSCLKQMHSGTVPLTDAEKVTLAIMGDVWKS